MMNLSLYLMTWLIVKHWVVDFFLQPRYMWQNKGTYGHAGGLLHAGLHALVTIFILLPVFRDWRAIVCGLVEGILHYHIDWCKENLKTRFQLDPTKHEAYWYLLGTDQFLHYMTYILILSMF